MAKKNVAKAHGGGRARQLCGCGPCAQGQSRNEERNSYDAKETGRPDMETGLGESHVIQSEALRFTRVDLNRAFRDQPRGAIGQRY